MQSGDGAGGSVREGGDKPRSERRAQLCFVPSGGTVKSK